MRQRPAWNRMPCQRRPDNVRSSCIRGYLSRVPLVFLALSEYLHLKNVKTAEHWYVYARHLGII
jgi:hypothetical protein